MGELGERAISRFDVLHMIERRAYVVRPIRICLNGKCGFSTALRTSSGAGSRTVLQVAALHDNHASLAVQLANHVDRKYELIDYSLADDHELPTIPHVDRPPPWRSRPGWRRY